MKKPRLLGAIYACTLALASHAANAPVITADLGDFSSSETVVDFSLPATNETQITNEYAG